MKEKKKSQKTQTKKYVNKPYKKPLQTQKAHSAKGKAHKLKGKLPVRGQGAIRSTGKSKLDPRFNPHTTLNPGNTDPSPSPTLRQSAYTSAGADSYKRKKPVNPVELQKNLLKASKGFKHMPGSLLKSKMQVGGKKA
jgi:hypothetical protein